MLSSDNEGTPVWLIEAAAAGRPAIATDVGGISEVVTPETGIVVPPDDEAALAAAISRLAADPELRRRMGRRARQHVLRRYSVGAPAVGHRRALPRALAAGLGRRSDQDLVEPLRKRPNGKRRPLPFGPAPFSAV